MAKKKQVKFYLGTASDGVDIFITAHRRKEAQQFSNGRVIRVRISKVGMASTIGGIFDNLCEPKPKKLPYDKSVNLG